MPVNKPLFFDLTDKIQHFLRTAHSKGWNHQITASVKSFLNDFRKHDWIIRSFSMTSVSISRLHHNIICLFNIYRILDQRLIKISDVSGKYDLALLHTLSSVLRDPHLNTGRSKQMPRIHKPDF